MNSTQILEVSADLVDKSAQMAENDPHGIIITIVSVSVVFASLIILYFAYVIVGKLVNWKTEKPETSPAEEAAAIGIALEQHINDKNHDKESYVVTIRRGQHDVASSAPVINHSTPAVNTAPAPCVPARTVSIGKNVIAPLPGVIVAVKVNVGDTIKAGQTVAILEAMKMENEIQAEHDGTVQSINVEKGDSVLEGTTIVTLS